MILHVSPESSALVHGAAATLLYLHIGGGTVGLVSGAAAGAMVAVWRLLGDRLLVPRPDLGNRRPAALAHVS